MHQKRMAVYVLKWVQVERKSLRRSLATIDQLMVLSLTVTTRHQTAPLDFVDVFSSLTMQVALDA